MRTICKNLAFSDTGKCLMGGDCVCEANEKWLTQSEELDSLAPLKEALPLQEGREFTNIKWQLGDIFKRHIKMSEDGRAIEGNPAIHRMAEWVHENMEFRSPSPGVKTGVISADTLQKISDTFLKRSDAAHAISAQKGQYYSGLAEGLSQAVRALEDLIEAFSPSSESKEAPIPGAKFETRLPNGEWTRTSEQQKSFMEDVLIPHDVISFWDEFLRAEITCPDHNLYDYWCYWMFRNNHPVFSIKIGHRIYSVGDVVHERKIISLFWKSSYWGFKDEKGWIMWLPSEQEAGVWDKGNGYAFAPEHPKSVPVQKEDGQGEIIELPFSDANFYAYKDVCFRLNSEVRFLERKVKEVQDMADRFLRQNERLVEERDRPRHTEKKKDEKDGLSVLKQKCDKYRSALEEYAGTEMNSIAIKALKND